MARKIEVSYADLNMLYLDLRRDTKEANEDGGNDEVQEIMERMCKVQQQWMNPSNHYGN